MFHCVELAVNAHFHAIHARFDADHSCFDAADARLEAAHARLEVAHARLEAADARLEAAHARFDSTYYSRLEAIFHRLQENLEFLVRLVTSLLLWNQARRLFFANHIHSYFSSYFAVQTHRNLVLAERTDRIFQLDPATLDIEMLKRERIRNIIRRD